MPSVATVLEHEKDCAMPGMAEACIDEAKVMVAVMRTIVIVADHFLSGGQFCGFSEGSSLMGCGGVSGERVAWWMVPFSASMFCRMGPSGPSGPAGGGV